MLGFGGPQQAVADFLRTVCGLTKIIFALAGPEVATG
jgi:hypothetical protein